MKKVLVILLAFLILTNFHCARFHVQTEDSQKVHATFKASMIEDSGEFLEEAKGTIVLIEESLIFKSKGETKEILYSQISSIDVQGNTARGIQPFTTPSFNPMQNRSDEPLWIFGILSFLIIFLLIWLFALKAISPNINIHFDTDSGLETATFKISKRGMAKIYPLLMEKVY